MNTHEIIKTFVNNHFDLYTKMTQCEHGFRGKEVNDHHIEGSIWAHTMMVMLIAEQNEYSKVIKLACLCHDLGKPFVYDDIQKNGKRRFSQHEAVSTFYTREVLRSFDVTPEETTRIIELVSQHGSLYNFFVCGRIPQKNMGTIAENYSIETFSDIAKLYKCDHEGRFYDHELSKNDNLIYDDFKQITLLQEIEDDFKYLYPKPKKPNTITILVGPPRAGKSSWCESNATNEVIISRDNLVMTHGIGESYSEKWKSLSESDQIFIDKELQSQYQKALKYNKDIIVDMTNMSKKSRKKWISDTKIVSYYKKSVIFIEPKSVLMSRMTPEKDIPEFVIDSMLKSFVYPNLNEFDEVILHCE